MPASSLSAGLEIARETLVRPELTPMADLVASCEWVLAQSKTVVGGRNFNMVHNCMGRRQSDPGLWTLLDDPDMDKLRRHGNDTGVLPDLNGKTINCLKTSVKVVF